MTFTEAAIEVLRREGKPLHFKKIAEIAVRENLLDHVGKVPEDVMGGQLVTHCKLPHADRKVVVVQSGTFALVEWGLDEDPSGLDHLIELPPEDDMPYRARERHPAPSREMARSSGRGEGRPPRRREEGEERRSRRYPPPAEVAFEILAGADHPLSLTDIAAQGAERLLMPDAFVRDSAALSAALLEDNKRRESAGRRPLFALDGEHVSLAAQPEPGERAATPLVPVRPAAPADLRKSALSALRRRLEACDPPTVEHVMAKLLEKMGVRELKVAKRGRDHVVYTGRRKLGLAEVRHCFRILRGGAEPGRRDISDARRDVGNYGAQIGVVLSAGEAGRETRSEATAAGQLPVLLLCGEALAEAFTENAVGCQPVVVPEIDEAFFRIAAEAAQQEEAARRARREERERRGEREPHEGREPQEGREPRESREPREGRESREAREPRESREPREGREPRPGREPREQREPRESRGEREVSAEREIVVEREVPAERAPRQRPAREERSAPGEAEAPILLIDAVEVSLERGARATIEAEESEEDGEEGDEDVSENAPPAAGAGAEGERPGEGRRRRRRRRRRGGRGRHREGTADAAPGAPAAASPSAGEASVGSEASSGGSTPAGEATSAPPTAPEPAGTPAPSTSDESQGGEH